MCLSSSFEVIGRIEIGSTKIIRITTGSTPASLRAEGQIPDWILHFRTLLRLSKIARDMSFSKGGAYSIQTRGEDAI